MGRLAENRKEPGHDDGLRPMLLEEEVRAVKVLLFQDHGILLEDRPPHGSSDREVHQIAKDCGQNETAHGHGPLQSGPRMGSGVSSHGKEQRITRKERGDDEPRLAEDNGEEDRIDPDTIGVDDVF